MSVTNFIALRLLRASRDSRFFSFIAILTISGVIIGIAANIVVRSVINGFETELRNRFLAANAHILAYKYPSGITNYEEWCEQIQDLYKDSITGVSPFVHAESMARNQHMLHAILIKGIYPDLRSKVQDMEEFIRPKGALSILQQEIDLVKDGGRLPQVPAIILGAGLLSLLNAKVGETIELIAPESENPMGSFKKFRVVGIYDSGLQYYDVKIGAMSIPAAQDLFSSDDRVTGLEVGLKDPDNSKAFAEKMAQSHNLTIKEWQSFNKNIFDSIKTQKSLIGMIVFLVGIVASFNIFTALIVSVSQKQREISILKALGASNRQILAIFVKQSLLLGSLGGIGGLALAFVISKLIEVYQFIDIPEVYFLASLPVTYDPYVYLSFFTLGVILCGFFGLIPAWTATRTSPIDGLRQAQAE
jgi:lipoprotein-releasing system permease protein